MTTLKSLGNLPWGLITMPISFANSVYQMQKMAKEINSIIKELGDDEYDLAEKKFKQAKKSPKPRPLILDGIKELEAAAKNFRKAAYRQYKVADRLSILERECASYALALKTWASLKREKKNTKNAGEELCNAVNGYIAQGIWVINDLLYLEGKSFRAKIERFLVEFGRTSAMSDGLKRPYINSEVDEREERRKEARQVLDSIKVTKERATKALNHAGVSSSSISRVPNDIDEIIKLK